MTRLAIREYADEIRARYRKASRKERGRILDEFVTVVKCHRKSATRLLARKGSSSAPRKQGRPRQYRGEVVDLWRNGGSTADWWSMY